MTIQCWCTHDSAGHIYDVHNDTTEDPPFGNEQVAVGELTWCSHIGVFSRYSQCGAKTEKNRMNPHGVLAANGIMHVVWTNVTDGTIEYDYFNTSNNQLDCNPRPIDKIAKPSNTTCAANTAWTVMPTLGNHNLEFDASPRIALEPVSQNIIVSWDSCDLAEFGVALVRNRVFTSINGTNWFQELINAQESAKGVIDVDGQGDSEVDVIYGNGGNRARRRSLGSVDRMPTCGLGNSSLAIVR